MLVDVLGGAECFLPRSASHNMITNSTKSLFLFRRILKAPCVLQASCLRPAFIGGFDLQILTCVLKPSLSFYFACCIQMQSMGKTSHAGLLVCSEILYRSNRSGMDQSASIFRIRKLLF
jgi:hypothetical protein